MEDEAFCRFLVAEGGEGWDECVFVLYRAFLFHVLLMAATIFAARSKIQMPGF